MLQSGFAFSSTFCKNQVRQLHEWGIEGTSSIEELVVFNEEDKRDISYLEFSVRVNRLGSYYLLNVFVLVYLLNVLCWWLFLIDPNTLNDRLQICITAFLALVAFNFVVAENLPKINHSTYLTHFFVLNYGFIVLCAVESGVSFLIDKYLPESNFITAKIVDWTVMGIGNEWGWEEFILFVLIVFFLSFSCSSQHGDSHHLCCHGQKTQMKTTQITTLFHLFLYLISSATSCQP